MLPKLDQLAERIVEINTLPAREDATANLDQYYELTREHVELEPVVAQFAAWKQVEKDIAIAQKLAADPDMKAFVEDKLRIMHGRMEPLEGESQRLLLPKDPNDRRNIFVEVRVGTGGDEPALFAGDLLRMYTRYVERQRWQVEVVSESVSNLGGYKEVIARLVGEGAYSCLKFGSGGHYVQRMSAMEAQRRVHASAYTAAIMPEADALADIRTNLADLRIDTSRASGADGQHINKTEPTVHIIHLPTGLVVKCQNDRSQHRNKDRAMQVLVARLKGRQEREVRAKEASVHKSLTGPGDHSDRIRTYNLLQGHVADHRINLMLYKINAIMDGGINELVGVSTTEYQTEQLAMLGEDS